MRVLVTGGRKYDNEAKVNEILDALPKEGLVIIQGEAAGADKLARKWAHRNGIKPLGFAANWTDLSEKPYKVAFSPKYGQYNLLAGINRNARMQKEGKPDLVIAFPTPGAKNAGTRNMIRIAKKAGTEVRIVE